MDAQFESIGYVESVSPLDDGKTFDFIGELNFFQTDKLKEKNSYKEYNVRIIQFKIIFYSNNLIIDSLFSTCI